MKRVSAALVEYSSSEEETPPAANEQPKEKKRKLPALSSSLTVPTPVDNPALHQGRVRTVPYVEGQYATYIYVPLVLYPKDALYKLAEEVLNLAKAGVPSLHPIGKQERDSAQWELHISLSRPLFLRAHQRGEFTRAIKQIASSIAPFDVSFTSFSDLTNDERTRSFLVLEVGAGHRELCRCLVLLRPTLRLLRQKEFYVDPKFHASVAWALLEKTPSSPDMASVSVATEPHHITLIEPDALEKEQLPNDLHRIPYFPHTLVPSLNGAFAAKLSQARTSGFTADRIAVKMGKDIFTWPLIGMR